MTDPSQQPDREEQIRQIMAYLEQHRAQYDLAALRQQLLDNGYSNTIVDEALRRLAGGAPSSAGGEARAVGCALSLVNQLPIVGIGYLAAALSNNILLLLIGIPIVLGIELIVYAFLRNYPDRERVTKTLLWTMIWTIALDVVAVALVALLFGICAALLSGI